MVPQVIQVLCAIFKMAGPRFGGETVDVSGAIGNDPDRSGFGGAPFRSLSKRARYLVPTFSLGSIATLLKSAAALFHLCRGGDRFDFIWIMEDQ